MTAFAGSETLPQEFYFLFGDCSRATALSGIAVTLVESPSNRNRDSDS
jgi:hypothetical protein